jgi:2-polyprenyl-3-methyl-5-hydroxy-6-metoxy-1,4-benzoquinol methylase
MLCSGERACSKHERAHIFLLLSFYPPFSRRDKRPATIRTPAQLNKKSLTQRRKERQERQKRLFAFPLRSLRLCVRFFLIPWSGWMERRRRAEIMDQPDLQPDRHVQALRGLTRINFFSHSAGILWPHLAELAKNMAPRVPRVLDVATGAGDVPLRLWKRAGRAGLSLDVEGCDLSPVALTHAQSRAAAAGAPLRFFAYNALTEPVLEGYDAVVCSLFLHHLDEPDAVALLQRLAAMAGRLLLVNDLERGWLGLLAAHVVTRLLTTSYVVHVDGPRSVEGAFTVAEARSLASRAGLVNAQVARRWPFRWLLTWSKA